MNDLDNELVKEFKDYCEQVLAKDIEIMKRFSELTGITTLKELWKIGTYPKVQERALKVFANEEFKDDFAAKDLYWFWLKAIYYSKKPFKYM